MLSLLLASGGAAQATLHLDCGLSAPTFTMTLIYFGLSWNVFILIWRNRRCDQVDRDMNGEDLLQIHAAELTSELALNATAAEDVHQYEQEIADKDNTARRDEHSCCWGYLSLCHPLWWYMIIAFLDVQANAITMLAFRYTTLTSVTLFDALAIPSSMIISKICLHRKYRWMHYIGVVSCMTGVVANIMTDYQSDIDSSNESAEENLEYPNKLRGDLCAITGGLLYGLNDVLTEITVSDSGDNTEYLGMMGFFAFLISLAQSLLLEWDDILEFFGEDSSHSSTCSLHKGWWLLFAFVSVTMLSYAGASRFLVISEAAFYNLSLLSGDLWSVIFSIVAERIIPHSLFFVALVFVLSGVLLYEVATSPAAEKVHIGRNSELFVQNANDGIIRQCQEPLSSH